MERHTEAQQALIWSQKKMWWTLTLKTYGRRWKRSVAQRRQRMDSFRLFRISTLTPWKLLNTTIRALSLQPDDSFIWKMLRQSTTLLSTGRGLLGDMRFSIQPALRSHMWSCHIKGRPTMISSMIRMLIRWSPKLLMQLSNEWSYRRRRRRD